MDAYHQDQSYNQQSFNQQSQPGQFECQIQSQVQSSNPVYLPQLPPSPGPETCDEIDYLYKIGSVFMNFMNVTHTPSSHISENFTHEGEGNQIKLENDRRNILDLDLHKAQMTQFQNQQNMFPQYDDLYMNNQDQELYIQTAPSSPSNQELFQSLQIPTEEYIGNAVSTTQEPLDQSSLSSYRAFEQLPPQTAPSTSKSASRKSNKAKRSKAYQCTDCDKSYSNSGRLERHYNTHKYVVKSIGQPTSVTLPINANHHSPCESTTGKDRSSNNPIQNSRRENANTVPIQFERQSASPGLLQEPSSSPYDMQPASNIHQPSPLHSPMDNAPLLENREAGTHPYFNMTTTVLTKSDEGKIICYECKKTFKGVCYLTQDKKAYQSDEEPSKCIGCGKSFASEKKYIKPYKCKMCPEQFNHINDLNRHMYFHTGNKPYKCKTCNKDFFNNANMLRHYNKTHTLKAQNKASLK